MIVCSLLLLLLLLLLLMLFLLLIVNSSCCFYSQSQPVGRKMARHQIKQIDLKSWEYKGIHHSKSAYWGRFLKTLLKFRDPLTGGLPWRMFSVDLFSLCNSFLDLYVNWNTYISIYIYTHLKIPHRNIFLPNPDTKKNEFPNSSPVFPIPPILGQRFICLSGVCLRGKTMI